MVRANLSTNQPSHVTADPAWWCPNIFMITKSSCTESIISWKRKSRNFDRGVDLPNKARGVAGGDCHLLLLLVGLRGMHAPS